ncbi:MAG: hypothetical protein VCE12_10905, partial [Candidatus Latescibacterota bacterium]
MRGWIHGLISGLVAFSLTACDQQEEEGRRGGASPSGRGDRAEAALPVKTVRVTRSEITSYVETHAR